MTLLAIAVFVAARRVGCLARQTIMAQQSLILLRENFRVAVGMHRQGQPIRAVPQRHPTQSPERVLHARAEAGETLRVTQGHVFPVRVRQHKMVGQMGECLPQDGYAQARQMREVRGPQTSWLVHLREKHFFGRSRRAAPTLDPPLQRSQQLVAVGPRMAFLQQRQQRVRLQTRSLFQLGLQFRPHRRQRIGPRPPRVHRPTLAGTLALPIFTPRLAIHVCLHRRLFQGRASL
jgi:hypothetical protein